MISSLHDSLEQAQDDVAQIIRADPYFAGMSIITFRRADVESEILRAIGIFGAEDTAPVQGTTKMGACLVVMPVVGSPDAKARTTPGFPLTMNIVVRIIENPTVNDDPTWGFGKRVGDIAIKLREILSYLQSENVFSPLVEDSPFYVPVEDPYGIAHEVRWTCRSVRTVSLSRVLNPIITVAAGSMSITCSTSGASIYFTVDGNVPTSESFAYSAPIAVTVGTVIRARAYKTGSIASDITTKEVS